MLSMQFDRNWTDLHEDPSGNTTRHYPKGIVIQMPPERAAYLLAVGYAIAVGEVSAELQAATDELAAVVKMLREHNVEPTIDAVYMTIADIVQAQQSQQQAVAPAGQVADITGDIQNDSHAAADTAPAPRKAGRRAAS